jgi:formate hydrogenlyase transcriptional activator
MTATKSMPESNSEQPRVELFPEVGEQLKFEALIADLSARFVNLPAEQVDSEIEHAQGKICECLGIDHSALWQSSDSEHGILLLTHLHRDPALPPRPSRMDGDTYFPWLQEKLLRKEIVSVSRIAEAPPEAATDRKHWEMYGIKSLLGFPLWVGNGSIFGVLSFEATTEEREWPEPLVKRLHLIAEVFANTLARKRTEQALRESETRLRLAAASAGAGLWTLESRTGHIWATEKTKELFGFGLTEEFDLKKFLQLVHPEDRESVRRIIEEAIQSGQESGIEYRIIRPDGELRWISGRGRRQSEGPGEPDRLMGVSIDITERKQLQQVLQESNDRLAGIVASAMDAIIAIDGDQHIVVFNAAAEKVFGCPACDAIGSPIDRFIPQRFQAEHRQHVREFGETKVTNRSMGKLGELWAVRANGEEFPIEASVSQVKAVGKRLYTVIIRDVTERTRAEAALRESEERFRLVCNVAPVMIWVSGTDKLCTFFNQRWLDFTGRSRERELGEGWVADVHPDDLERCVRTYTEAFDARLDFKMDYRLRRFDGEFRWVVDHGAPRFEPDGNFVGYIGSCVDITESKVAQEELKNSYAEVKQLKEKLEAESSYLQGEIKDIGRFHEIVGESKAIKEVLMKVEQVAGTDSVVIITGETGTGKELIARAIHHLSKRKEQVMVKVDCAALPPTLIESELFGREKGAYTGALSKQFGRFETADGSTLFLDEIGELGVEIQAKLLRVVQDGEFERLGSSKTSHVDVRLIAATHRDLAERVKNGTFREDLFYRLHVFPIHVPPLRERPEDIPLLVMAFVREFEKKMGKTIRGVPARLMDELKCYPWPGNIRELRNVIERAVIVTSGDKLNLQLPKSLLSVPTRTLKETEYQHILAILQKTGWRIKGPNGAAAILGVKPSTLYNVMHRLHIPTGHEKGGIRS